MKAETLRRIIVVNLVNEFIAATKNSLNEYQDNSDVEEKVRDILRDKYDIYSSIFPEKVRELLEPTKINVDFSVEIEFKDEEYLVEIEGVELTFYDLLQGPYHWEDVSMKAFEEKARKEEAFSMIDFDKKWVINDLQDNKIYWAKDKGDK